VHAHVCVCVCVCLGGAPPNEEAKRVAMLAGWLQPERSLPCWRGAHCVHARALCFAAAMAPRVLRGPRSHHHRIIKACSNTQWLLCTRACHEGIWLGSALSLAVCCVCSGVGVEP
jgi:hypothetical protein